MNGRTTFREAVFWPVCKSQRQHWNTIVTVHLMKPTFLDISRHAPLHCGHPKPPCLGSSPAHRSRLDTDRRFGKVGQTVIHSCRLFAYHTRHGLRMAA